MTKEYAKRGVKKDLSKEAKALLISLIGNADSTKITIMMKRDNPQEMRELIQRKVLDRFGQIIPYSLAYGMKNLNLSPEFCHRAWSRPS